MAAEEQYDKMMSDMEVCMKQMCEIEFLHVEKKGAHRHSSTLAKHLWRPNDGNKHSEAVDDTL